MTKRHNRMMLVGLLVSGVFLAGYLGIKAFSENLLYFYTPSDIITGKAPKDKSFRLDNSTEEQKQKITCGNKRNLHIFGAQV